MASGAFMIWRAGIAILKSMALCAACLGTIALLAAIRGGKVTFPEAVTQAVQNEVNRRMEGEKAGIGEMTFLLDQKTLSPGLLVSGLELFDINGERRVLAPRAYVSVDPAALLTGSVKIQGLDMENARVNLIRFEDGSFNFAYRESEEFAGTVSEVVDRVNTALDDDALERLREIRIRNTEISYDDRRLGNSWLFTGGDVLVKSLAEGLRAEMSVSLERAGGKIAFAKMRFQSDSASKAIEIKGNLSNYSTFDLASQVEALDWLRILDSEMSAEMGLSVGRNGSLERFDVQLHLDGGYYLSGGSAFSSGEFDLSYSPDGEVLTFRRISLDSEVLGIMASGESRVTREGERAPVTFATSLDLESFHYHDSSMFQNPLKVSSGKIAFDLSADPFNLQIESMSIQDSESIYDFSGGLRTGSEGVEAKLFMHVDRLSREKLLGFWPKTGAQAVPRWLEQNIRSVTIRNAIGSVETEGGSRPKFELDFEFEGLEARYLPGFPWASHSRGSGSLRGGRFALAADDGLIEPVEGSPIVLERGGFEILGLDGEESEAVVDLRASGELRPLFHLMDSEPLRVFSSAGLSPDIADGEFSAGMRLALPLRKEVDVEDIQLEVDGEALSFRSEALAPGKEILAERLEFSVKDGAFNIEGDASLDGIAVSGGASFEIAGGRSPGSEARVNLSAEGEIKPLLHLLDSEPFGALSGAGLSPDIAEGSFSADMRLALPLGKKDITMDDIQIEVDGDARSIRSEALLPGREILAERLEFSIRDRAIKVEGDASLDGISVSGGASFEIPGGRSPGSEARINLAAEGEIKPLLHLLDSEPLGVLSGAGLSPDIAEGSFSADMRLALPVGKKEITLDDIHLEADGEALSFRSAGLAPGREILADRLGFSIRDMALRVEGEGSVDGVEVSGAVSADLSQKGSGKVVFDGQAEISPRALETLDISVPGLGMEGRTDAEIAVEIQRGQPVKARFKSDLKGLGISYGLLRWEKAAKESGVVEIAGTLPAGESPMRLDTLEVDVSGLVLSGGASFNPDNSLARARLRRARLGDWIDVAFNAAARKGKPIGFEVVSGSVDFTKFPEGLLGGESAAAEGGGGKGLEEALGEAGSGSSSVEATIKSLDVKVSEGISLTGLSGSVMIGGGFEGSLAGQVNGGERISATAEQKPGFVEVAVKSDDAGGVLRSAGLTDSILGGELEISVRTTPKPGVLKGRLVVTESRVLNAPILAELISIVSLIGVLEKLGGEGLAFLQMETDFTLGPDQIYLRDASAIGPSIGLTASGVYRLDSQYLDIGGTITPIYALNGFLERTKLFFGIFGSRQGEGIFGFNYNLKGPVRDPSVTINPLSILAPGILRTILFPNRQRRRM